MKNELKYEKYTKRRRIGEKEYEYEERWDSKEIIDKKNKGKKVEDME